MKMWYRPTALSRALSGISLLCLTVLGGCVSPPPAARASDRERLYVGWVRFAGEFELYADPSAFADSQAAHCVSGALPLAKQKEAAALLSGKRVKVRARAVPWSQLGPEALSMSYEGSPIINWCGDKVVLFASEMKLDETTRSPER